MRKWASLDGVRGTKTMLYVLIAVGSIFIVLMWARGKQTQVQDDRLCRKLDHAAQIFEFRIRSSLTLTPPEKAQQLAFWEWFRDDQISCRDYFDPESILTEFERKDK